MEFEATDKVLLLGFLLSVLLGVIVNRTNFCTMGSISDWINSGDKGRLWAWFSAIAIALIGTTALEVAGIIELNQTIPPYRTAQLSWARYLLGGFMFGIGMTLAGGCGNKTLINIGTGNLKSLFVGVVIAVMAYLMTKTSFYEIVFYDWVLATTIDLGQFKIQDQSVASLADHFLGMENPQNIQIAVAVVVSLTILVFALKSAPFRKLRNIVSSLSVGLAIIAVWFITGGALGQEAIEQVEWMDQRPLSVGVQSYTFVNPFGESLNYLMSPNNFLLVTFGVVALVGVILGSFAASVSSGTFHWVWFTSWPDFFRNLVGAVLMGIGGVLAMGCTIGHGISGISTLAFGSFLVISSIIFGSALCMKIMYYQMLYEDEASFMDATISSLVDMRLMPERMRKLEKM